MRHDRWLRGALRAYPRSWRERYEREVLDLAVEMIVERGEGERRVALGLLLNAPRAWILRRRALKPRHVLVGVALAVAGIATGLASVLVPATPAASSPFKIASGAMEPALKLNEVVQVRQVSVSAPIAQGQIVVFRNPPTENCGGPTAARYLVKRVVGLPGETISLSDGFVVINGKRLREPWLATSEQGSTFPGPAGTTYSLAHAFRIPPRSYFVLGDNRIDSCDSRYWGPVSRSLVYGVVSGQ
jgi:signal peptidase I